MVPNDCESCQLRCRQHVSSSCLSVVDLFCQGRAANLRHACRKEESWHVELCGSHRCIWNTPAGILLQGLAHHVDPRFRPLARSLLCGIAARLRGISCNVAEIRSGLGLRKACSRWRCRRSFSQVSLSEHQTSRDGPSCTQEIRDTENQNKQGAAGRERERERPVCPVRL